MGLFQHPLGAQLVIGVAVAVQEQDRHRLHAQGVDLDAQRAQPVLVQRDGYLPGRQHALPDLEAQRALDQGFVLLEEQVVGIGPVDPADLVDVAEPLGGDQRRLRAGALKDRVDRNRRAVQEQARRAERGAGLCDPGLDAVDQAVRRRQRLAQQQRAGGLVERRDVGERPADIGCQPDPRARARRLIHHRRPPRHQVVRRLDRRPPSQDRIASTCSGGRCRTTR